MSQDDVNRMFELMLSFRFAEEGVDAGENVKRLTLPPIDALIASMSEKELVQDHEGRFTTLSGSVVAKQYLSCRVEEEGLPVLRSGLTYAQSASERLVVAAALAGSDSVRPIAGRGIRQNQDEVGTLNPVDRVATLNDPSVEDLLDLGFGSVESVFGIEDLHVPGLLVGLTIQSYLDDGLCLADEEVALVTLYGSENTSEGLDAVADEWVRGNEQALTRARLKVSAIRLVAVRGAVTDELRAVLTPSSVITTLFGAFSSGEYKEAADYTQRMLALAERLHPQERREAARLIARMRDLRSRLVFLRAIVGDHATAMSYAEELQRGGNESWLDLYNRALLRGFRDEWVLAAEALADLEPNASEGILRFFLLIHLPGMPPGQNARQYFADVSTGDVHEVVSAQRMSLEAMTGRYTKSEYLSHVQTLRSTAARRTAIWTLATRYRDEGLAQTVLGQLLESDPACADIYQTDLALLNGSRTPDGED